MAEMRLDLGSIGTSGLKQTSGTIDEEWLAKLKSGQGLKVYQEMAENSDVIGGILYVIETLLRQAEWRIEPADETPLAQQWAAFTEECLDDMSHTWDTFLSEVLTMIVAGWSYFETCYKLRGGPAQEDPSYRSKHKDGLIGWRKFGLRAQDTRDRWEFDRDGGLRGMWQNDPYAGHGTVFIPIEKSLLFRTRSNKGNPEGRSMLRNAVRSYWFTKRIQEIEAIGIERDLSGYPVMQVPTELLLQNAGPSQIQLRQQLERLVQEIRRDEREGALIPTEVDADGKPTGFKLTLLSTGGKRAIDTSGVISRYESRMAVSLMAEFVLLGLDKVGSFALASSKTHLFSVGLGAIMDGICEVFNRFAIGRLMELNRAPSEAWPKLVHGDLEAPPLEEIGGFVTALATAGVLGTGTPLERKLLEYARLPIEDLEGATHGQDVLPVVRPAGAGEQAAAALPDAGVPGQAAGAAAGAAGEPGARG